MAYLRNSKGCRQFNEELVPSAAASAGDQERANAAVAVAESNGPPDAQRPSRQQGEAGDELGEGKEQRGRSPPRPEKRAESPRPSGRMSPTTKGRGRMAKRIK